MGEAETVSVREDAGREHDRGCWWEEGGRERGREEGAGGKGEEQISSRGCELLAQHSRNGTGHAKQTAKIPLVGSGSRRREHEGEEEGGMFRRGEGGSRERLSEGERGGERISTDIRIIL